MLATCVPVTAAQLRASMSGDCVTLRRRLYEQVRKKLSEFLAIHRVRVLNVAGHRADIMPREFATQVHEMLVHCLKKTND